MATDYEKAIEVLWQDLRSLRGDLKSVTESLRQTARAGIGDARTAIQDKASEKLVALRQAAGSVAHRGKLAARSVGRQIEKRPLASVLTAAGIGLALGFYLRGRRR